MFVHLSMTYSMNNVRTPRIAFLVDTYIVERAGMEVFGDGRPLPVAIGKGRQ